MTAEGNIDHLIFFLISNEKDQPVITQLRLELVCVIILLDVPRELLVNWIILEKKFGYIQSSTYD